MFFWRQTANFASFSRFGMGGFYRNAAVSARRIPMVLEQGSSSAPRGIRPIHGDVSKTRASAPPTQPKHGLGFAAGRMRAGPKASRGKTAGGSPWSRLRHCGACVPALLRIKPMKLPCRGLERSHWPLAFLWNKIQLGLAGHGLQIFECADTLRIRWFRDANQCGEGACPRKPAGQPRVKPNVEFKLQFIRSMD